jgi:hypothetical protein
MRGRSGPSWDGVEGRAPAPPAPLGARPVPVDPPAERALPAAGPAPPGHQQGPDRPPRRDLVLLEAVLSDADGAVIATATATAQVIPLRDAPAAARPRIGGLR